MENWYYVSPKTEESVGPVSIGKLIDEATPETMVWKEESLPEWVAAKNHPDLIDFLDNLAENNHSNITPSVEEQQDGAILNGINSVEKSANLLIQMPTRKYDGFGCAPSELKYAIYFDNQYFKTLNAFGTSEELLIKFNVTKSIVVLRIDIKGVLRIKTWLIKKEFSVNETREISLENLDLNVTAKIILDTTKALNYIPVNTDGKFMIEFTTLFRDDNFVEL
jgi:hypothetical protein